VLAAIAAGFVYFTQGQGWIDWPFLAEQTEQIEEIPAADDPEPAPQP